MLQWHVHVRLFAVAVLLLLGRVVAEHVGGQQRQRVHLPEGVACRVKGALSLSHAQTPFLSHTHCTHTDSLSLSLSLSLSFSRSLT